MLGACTVCPTLRLELEEKNITIRSLEKDVAPRPPTVDCLVCPGLIGDMDDLTVEKTNLENENTNLRAILSWVSCHEPQLGMIIKQYQCGDGFGVGYAYTQSDFDMLYGKIGKAAGVSSACNVVSTSAQPVPTQVDPMEGVFQERSRAPPQKQVWLPKPNELRNPLDTFPAASAKVAQEKWAAPHPKVNKHRSKAVPQPPRREVRYHYEYCQRDGHLKEFFFRRK